ncbi:MAG: DUF3769 domain-containing protein [Geminocystis sp.]|nr:DUF3769 domain-containing protein [Geminocystis sp.]MCS7146828.1 DUF3769 domain-containing protein [Geminocystis sp.]MCX8077023.1 DUF3769 domain-containing protein [Geminocystis sp.]MDW8115653.1 DUF3769 domain-containing protein [Geminocystis sp.]HIK36747.1 DUF3769 domain-containing protein [Geminocystis sp. M7585_C2015_104]
MLTLATGFLIATTFSTVEVASENNSAALLGNPPSVDINSFPPHPKITNNPSKRIVIYSRSGSSVYYDFNLSAPDGSVIVQNNPSSEAIPAVEILADEQEYLAPQEIVKARGNVVIRFDNGILTADEVLVNLRERLAVAQGNVSLQRGDQKLRGDRFEYYFTQDRGVIFNAQGEIYQPSITRDFRGDTGNNPLSSQILSQQLQANQPLRRVVSAGGYEFAVGSIREFSLLQGGGLPTITAGGQINRLRFQAQRVDFDGQQWYATNIRVTNDPFSPPELELRADSARLRSISPFQDELTTSNSRLVFDQTVSIPIIPSRLVIDKRRRPGWFSVGFDGEELGGLYIEREFELHSDEKVRFSFTPRFLLQRAFFPDSFPDKNAVNPDHNGGIFNSTSYALLAQIQADFNERTNLRGIFNLTGLDLDNIENRLRASAQLDYKFGNLSSPHTLSLQYNYRDRLFNGSLGFQTVQQSYGLVINSPYIPIPNSPFGIVYQTSIQNINAETDKKELLRPNRSTNRVTLTRYQGAAILTGNILLWSGKNLPPTAEEGLKYTPTPVTPFLSLNTGLTAVASYYSNGDVQPAITATIGIQGQFGHFSRPFGDYTGFQLGFSQGIRGSQSPFLFDRFADEQVLSLGFTQQLYGPLRVGIQTFRNLKTNQEISTDYFLEYSRRTYNIIIRYNPVLQLGSIGLRISDFNWEGNPGGFDTPSSVRPVVDTIKRDN